MYTRTYTYTYTYISTISLWISAIERARERNSTSSTTGLLLPRVLGSESATPLSCGQTDLLIEDASASQYFASFSTGKTVAGAETDKHYSPDDLI